MTTTFLPTNAPNTNDSGVAGQSFRQECFSISTSGDQVRISMKASASGMVVAHASIAKVNVATPPNCDATPIELLFSGASGYSAGANATVTSDWVAFPVTAGDNLMVINDVTSGAEQYSLSNTNAEHYYKAASSSYNAATVSGYSHNGTQINAGVVSIESRQIKTITASVGTFVLTGIAAILKAGKGIVATRGTYAVTGVAAALRSTRSMLAAKGTYALSGIATLLTKQWRIAAAKGTYALTGIAVALKSGRTLVAAKGTYALTGIAATVKKAIRISSAVGSYALTGNAAIVKKAIRIIASVGTFTLTGIALVVSEVIAPASKFKRRLANFVLQKLRQTPPTLED